ncbi:protein takeout-like [Tenebrio molitor]|uniref:protein takeout-like n=1 Tax=Tenebrio molitor TaxID=7067 RepID=UPI00362476AF
MNFDYEFIGNIQLLPIHSKEPGRVDIIKPKNVLTFKFEEYKKKGKQYIRITDHKFLWTPQQLVFILENLFGDNEALNKNLNVFNENWKALYDHSGPNYEGAFGKIFAAIANSFFGKVPVSELFDN